MFGVEELPSIIGRQVLPNRGVNASLEFERNDLSLRVSSTCMRPNVTYNLSDLLQLDPRQFERPCDWLKCGLEGYTHFPDLATGRSRSLWADILSHYLQVWQISQVLRAMPGSGFVIWSLRVNIARRQESRHSWEKTTFMPLAFIFLHIFCQHAQRHRGVATQANSISPRIVL